jgi:cellulose biosynthesis protein BcsQ
VVLGLTGAARARGLRTLVVDLDPQANATTVLDPADVRLTASEVLADGRARVTAEAVSTTARGLHCQSSRANRHSPTAITRSRASRRNIGCEPR